MLIDTHCHLHDAESFPDVEDVVARAVGAGVSQMVAVGVQPGDWQAAVNLAERFPEVFAIVGWHPNYTAHVTDQGFDLLELLLGHPKVLALGEIGLDYHWDYADRSQQMSALLRQLEIGASHGKPLVFHCREAYGDLLDVLERRRPPHCLFHCWAGTAEEALRAVALNCFFGVDGPITYKSAGPLREIVAALPQDRIVIETDSPYMPPVPYRGKRNEPAHLVHINEGLANVLGLNADRSAEVTTSNARRFFGMTA